MDIETIGPDFSNWDALLALIHGAFAYMDGVVDPPASGLRLTVDELSAKARTETGLIAVEGGRIVGCAFLAEKDDHVYLGKLAVCGGYQRRGIGQALVRHAEALARR